MILLAFKFLYKDKYEITVLTRQSRAEYSRVKLPSPVNASLAIDVIWFVCMVLVWKKMMYSHSLTHTHTHHVPEKVGLLHAGTLVSAPNPLFGKLSGHAAIKT